jgi:hypothetical protein
MDTIHEGIAGIMTFISFDQLLPLSFEGEVGFEVGNA